MKTDLQLQKDILDELAWEPSIDHRHIGVAVDSGVVTISGHATSFSEKMAAEQAVRRVGGVKALAVELDVRLPSDSRRSDTEIAKSVENTLMWTSNVPINFINIMVENGWVTLSGAADWEYQCRAAEDAVRPLLGVTGITNEMQIQHKPKVSSDTLKADIEQALKRLAVNEAQGIKVETNGSDVTLTGTVHSWIEADMARQTAWRAPGVKHVINHMTLDF
jgi:osmotically-inducible protein OsmY